MTTEMVLYNSAIEFKFWETKKIILSDGHHGLVEEGNNIPEILFITSFPPRECGIATYSQDLVDALNNQFENSFTCTICALESETEQHIY